MGLFADEKTQSEEDNSDDHSLSRFWIYSHHIKNQKKRQMIIDLSQEFNLKGMTCVGKPGN